MEVCAATAQLPGASLPEACQRLSQGVEEAFGGVSTRHIQLCPQTRSALDEEMVDLLRQRFPETRFRLHANLPLSSGRPPRLDASTVSAQTWPYYQRLAALSRRLGAPLYSLHAGRRRNCSLERLKDNLAALSQLFETPVAVEGMYPTSDDAFLLSTAEGYRWMLEQGMDYALDLSHLHILAQASGGLDPGLVRALLSSPRCREVHLSSNDGRRDQHRPLRDLSVWWWSLLMETRPWTHATLFTEGMITAGRGAAPGAADLPGASPPQPHTRPGSWSRPG